MGWFLQLVVAYTVIDIDAALESDLGLPYAAYLQQVLPEKVTLAILALTIICAFSMGQGCMVIPQSVIRPFTSAVRSRGFVGRRLSRNLCICKR